MKENNSFLDLFSYRNMQDDCKWNSVYAMARILYFSLYSSLYTALLLLIYLLLSLAVTAAATEFCATQVHISQPEGISMSCTSSSVHLTALSLPFSAVHAFVHLSYFTYLC